MSTTATIKPIDDASLLLLASDALELWQPANFETPRLSLLEHAASDGLPEIGWGQIWQELDELALAAEPEPLPPAHLTYLAGQQASQVEQEDLSAVELLDRLRRLGPESMLTELERQFEDRRATPEERAQAVCLWLLEAGLHRVVSAEQLQAARAVAMQFLPSAPTVYLLSWRVAAICGAMQEAIASLRHLITILDLRVDPFAADVGIALVAAADGDGRIKLLDRFSLLGSESPLSKASLWLHAVQLAADGGPAVNWGTVLDQLRSMELPDYDRWWLDDWQSRVDISRISTLADACQRFDALPASARPLAATSLLHLAYLQPISISANEVEACQKTLLDLAEVWTGPSAVILRVLARIDASQSSSRQSPSPLALLEWVQNNPTDSWAHDAMWPLLADRTQWLSLLECSETRSQVEYCAPLRGLLWLHVAELAERHNDLLTWIAAVERAYSEAPGSTECIRALGRAYERCRRWGLATQLLSEQANPRGSANVAAVEVDRSEQVVALERLSALASQRIRDTEQALSALVKATQVAPKDIAIQLQLANLARRADRMPLLATVLGRLLNAASTDQAKARLHAELGTTYYQRLSRREEAVKQLNLALSLDPEQTGARRLLVEYFARSGHLDELQRFVELARESSDVVALSELVWVARDIASDPQLAGKLAVEVLQQDPDRLECQRIGLGQLLVSGQRQAAYELACKAEVVHEDPQVEAEAHLERVGLLIDFPLTGAPEPKLYQALCTHLEAMLAIFPGHCGALERLRALHRVMGNLRGLEQAEQARRDSPGYDRWLETILAARRAMLDPDRKLVASQLYAAALAEQDDPVLRVEYEACLDLGEEIEDRRAASQREANEIAEPALAAAYAFESAEMAVSATPPDVAAACRLLLDALGRDQGNPHAVALLEELLMNHSEEIPLRQCVAARAVRPQSPAERAIFFIQSAEFLEASGQASEANRAYQAAEQTLSGLSPVRDGHERTRSARSETRGRKESGERGPNVSEDATRSTIFDLPGLAASVARAVAARDTSAARSLAPLLAEAIRREPNQMEAVRLAVSLVREDLSRTEALRALDWVVRHSTSAQVVGEALLVVGELEAVDTVALTLFDETSQRVTDLADREFFELWLRRAKSAGTPSHVARVLGLMRERLNGLSPGEGRRLELEGLQVQAETSPGSPEVLERARGLLRESLDDPKSLLAVCGVFQKLGHPHEAAQVVAQMISQESHPTRLHRLYLLESQLLAQVEGQHERAIQVALHAVVMRPDDRSTVEHVVTLLSARQRLHELEPYIPSIRAGFSQRFHRGQYTSGDLQVLGRAIATTSRPLSQVTLALHACLESSDLAKVLHPRVVYAHEDLHTALTSEKAQQRLRSESEPPGLASLLAELESAMNELRPLFPSMREQSFGPVPAELPTELVNRTVKSVLRASLGDRTTHLHSARRDGCVAIWVHGDEVKFGLSEALWNNCNFEAMRGLTWIGMARHAWGAARVRSLPASELDWLIAGAFEAAGVFNTICTTVDPKALATMSELLRKVFSGPREQQLAEACEALAGYDFVPHGTAEALHYSDVLAAYHLCGEPRCLVAASSALAGTFEGTVSQQIAASPTVSGGLLAYLASETHLEVVAQRPSKPPPRS